MAAPFLERNRLLVPRWRETNTAIITGELTPLTSKEHNPEFLLHLLNEKLEEIPKDNNISFLADALSAAVALGLESHALPLASKLNEIPNLPHGLRSLVNHIIPPIMPDVQDTGPINEKDIYERIRYLKRVAQLDPRNAFTWLDQSLHFETLGQQPKADEAIRRSLILAGNNRHVARSYVRLLLHRNRYDEAHAFVSRMIGLRSDPWLLATEISLASIVGKTSEHIVYSRKLVRDEKFAPLHLSEVSSVIGTLELEAGSFRQGLKLVRDSLRAPTENAFAQARWIERKYKASLVHSVPSFTSTVSAEAEAVRAYHMGEWKQSLHYGLSWLRDQPFSSRPAVLVSHLLLAAEDRRDDSEAILNMSIRANPKHPVIANNLAFTQASLGKTTQARATLAKFDTNESDPISNAVIEATKGYIEFKDGNSLMGRDYYLRATDSLVKLGASTNAVVARMYWALEELRVHGRSALPLTQGVIDTALTIDNPFIKLLLSKVEQERLAVSNSQETPDRTNQ